MWFCVDRLFSMTGTVYFYYPCHQLTGKLNHRRFLIVCLLASLAPVPDRADPPVRRWWSLCHIAGPLLFLLTPI